MLIKERKRLFSLVGVAGLAIALCGFPALADGAHSGNGKVKVKVLVEGSTTPGANGLFFDHEGRLVIASFLGTAILLMDPKSGEVLETIDRPSDTPDDVTVGPDGSLYWTSTLTSMVVRRTPDGEITSQRVGNVPNPITFNEEGRLFVAECSAFGGSGLYELDPELVEPPRFITDRLGTACGVNGMDFGPDGYLYGPRMFKGDIVRIDVESGEFETVASGFPEPIALKFSADGWIYVADAVTGEVWRVDPASGERILYFQLFPGLDNLAIDAEGRLYVSDGVSGSIYRREHNGKVRPLNRGGLLAPGAITVATNPDGKESVWVGDPVGLFEFDATNGKPRGEALSLPHAPFAPPLSASPSGKNVLITSWLANAVQIWDPSIPAIVEQRFDFAVPTNAILFRGQLVVNELGMGRVVVAQGGPGLDVTPLIEGLFVPLGLAATDDDLWVGDWATGTIWQLARNGVFLDQPTLVAQGLAQPEGLAVAGGDLLVVEAAAHRLSRIDLADGKVSTVADGLAIGKHPLPGLVPYGWFTQVAVGPSGAFYVTGDVDRVVYKIEVK